MDEQSHFPNPLAGVKVLDLSHVQSGPTCTAMLADLGAEVIKVESFAGDQFREPMEGANFFNFNRNKRGIALNLKAKEGLEIALKLARQADVFVENFLPGSMDRLGLGYESISRINPRIVYCSISGFGQSGPFWDRPAYEPILQAMSGIMDSTGEPGRPPVRIRPAMVDYCTGANAAFAIAAALFGREKTGRGQRIDVALLDVALFAMAPYVTQFLRKGELPERAGSAQPSGGAIQNFETRDGLIYVVAGTDHMFKNFCKALNREDLANDPRYANRKLRAEKRLEIAEVLNRETRKYASAELEAKLLAADVACGSVRTIGDIVREPHVQARGILEEAEYPAVGRVVAVKTPLFLSGKAAPLRRRAPLLGEHTGEVLKELGYSDAEIENLIRTGVARRPGSK
jgi:crotonobetainyl-CoA:carnitine CoA-transferase CaiB-like acyl-CoA transferase